MTLECPPPRADDEPLFGAPMNSAQVARVLGIRESTLRKWRAEGRGPPFFLVGRVVWFLRSDVVAFLRRCRVHAK